MDKIHNMHLFDDGWNKLRERIFENQKRLGVIPADTKLEPWPTKVIKNWDDCTPEEKKLFIKQVEIFAAYEAYNDHEIGRVIQAVEDMGKLDNTLIIYINGDNGTSAEGGPLGTPNEVAFFNGVNMMPVAEQMKWYDVWGTEQTYNHMSAGWSWAFDTPFTWFKQNASKLGGIRQCMAVSWPGHIKDQGGLREQFCHVIDIVPTLLEVCGIPPPEYRGRHQAGADRGHEPRLHLRREERQGTVTAQDPVFRDDGPVGAVSRRLAAEHQGEPRAVGGLRRRQSRPAQQPGARTLRPEQGLQPVPEHRRQASGQSEGDEDRCSSRKRRSIRSSRWTPRWRPASWPRVRTSPPAARSSFTPGPWSACRRAIRRCCSTAPTPSRRTSKCPQGGAEGMILTSGGRFAGYGFYLLKGKPVFLWNLIDLKRIKWEGPDALTPGKHTLEFDFKYDGLGVGTLAFNNMSGLGRPGTGTLKVDGKAVANHDHAAHAAHDPAMGRELRHRLRHADRRERRGLPAAVHLDRQAQQADDQGGPAATVARGHQEAREQAQRNNKASE